MKDLSNIVVNGKYRLCNRIGSGSYGIVYAAQHCFTGASYAVKIILKNNSTNTSNNKQLLVELEKNLIYQALMNNGVLHANLLNLDLIEKHGADCRFLREISLQLKVHKHPNVLSIFKVYDFDNSIFVVMDYYPEGDLFATIVDKQRYKDDPYLVKSVFVQMVDAINYCHSKGVFHCDLKPENVLVANGGTRVVLADFGLALQDKFIDSNISCGSSYYMSPERIQNFSQGFNTMESHSIHLERLLDPQAHRGECPQHGNVKFPTSAGDVWSLSIILINLICIRNPWLKASFHDTTFKAFVQDRKILMKILPISNEVFHILCKYLSLNPWERGTLFELRTDILSCHKLTETGPLSINSALGALDIITTESQMNINYDDFSVCPIPVDHVALQRQRSREDVRESQEVENNYIPESTKNDVLNNGGIKFADAEAEPKQPKGHSKDCKNCVDCGFGYDFNECFGGGNESGTSLMTLSTSYSNYGAVNGGIGANDNLGNNFSEHQIQLENEKRKAQAAQRDYQLQQQQLRAERQRQMKLQQQQQQQQLLLQQQQQKQQQLQEQQLQQQLLQQQQALQQQQQQSHHHLFSEQNGNLLTKLFKHGHQRSTTSSPSSQSSQKRNFYPQPGMSQSQQQQQQYVAPPSNVQPEHPSIVSDFKSFFPMPGMNHNTKPILTTAENRRKKFVTKKRTRRVITTPQRSSSPEQIKHVAVTSPNLSINTTPTDTGTSTMLPLKKQGPPKLFGSQQYSGDSYHSNSDASVMIDDSEDSSPAPGIRKLKADNDVNKVSEHLSGVSIDSNDDSNK